MNIFDLNEIEVVNGSEVVGGNGYSKDDYLKKYGKKIKFPKISVAAADGDSKAVGGKINVALTDTDAAAFPGAAFASSSSVAVTVGEHYDYH